MTDEERAAMIAQCREAVTAASVAVTSAAASVRRLQLGPRNYLTLVGTTKPPTVTAAPVTLARVLPFRTTKESK